MPLSGRPGGGYDLLGNPFNVGVPHADVRITTAIGACAEAGCSLDEAFALPEPERVAADVFYAYNGADYVRIDSGSVIAPWQGFWMRELAASGENAPTLHFPGEPIVDLAEEPTYRLASRASRSTGSSRLSAMSSTR